MATPNIMNYVKALQAAGFIVRSVELHKEYDKGEYEVFNKVIVDSGDSFRIDNDGLVWAFDDASTHHEHFRSVVEREMTRIKEQTVVEAMEREIGEKVEALAAAQQRLRALKRGV